MQTARKILSAGIATVALAGGAGLALAQGPAFHTVTVQFPDGGTATIRYTGEAAPQVTFGGNPLAAGFYEPVQPFLALDRISAQMDREMAALMRQADAMAFPPANPDQVFEAGLRSVPPGTTSYSFVSTMAGNGVCTRFTEITSTGGRPKVVTRTSGHCGPMNNATLGPVMPQSGAGRLIQAAAGGSTAAPRVTNAVYRSAR